MSITAALVLFSVTWFMVFFIVLPIRFKSQGETGTVVPGTPSSAPAEENVKRKAWITTLVAVPLACAISAVILWGGITIRDIDVFHRMGPETGVKPAE
jgi:predicted secreted protein